MNQDRQALGRWGEKVAASYLTGCGYQLLGCNIRTPYGEIDILTSQPNLPNDPNSKSQEDDLRPTIVFVEVKTRASSSLGQPEISITPKKRAHLENSALYYIQQHPELDTNWRIDVICIQRGKPGQPLTITHFKNVIQ